MSAPTGKVVEAGAADDERLAALLAGFSEAVRRGATPDLDSAARANPDLAGELRALWAAMELADAMGRDARSSTTVLPAHEPSASASRTPLPGRIGDFEILGELG